MILGPQCGLDSPSTARTSFLVSQNVTGPSMLPAHTTYEALADFFYSWHFYNPVLCSIPAISLQLICLFTLLAIPCYQKAFTHTSSAWKWRSCRLMDMTFSSSTLYRIYCIVLGYLQEGVFLPHDRVFLSPGIFGPQNLLWFLDIVGAHGME